MRYLTSRRQGKCLVTPNGAFRPAVYKTQPNGMCAYLMDLDSVLNKLVYARPMLLDSLPTSGVRRVESPYAFKHMLVGTDADRVPHTYEMAWKSSSKWHKRSPYDIVVNPLRKIRIEADEIPKPKGAGTNVTVKFHDSSLERVILRCGGVRSKTSDHEFGPENGFSTPNYGKDWVELLCKEHTSFEPFIPTFNRQIAEAIALQLTPYGIDPGPVTDALSAQNRKDWDVAVELGEIPETIKMAIDTCKSVLRLKRRIQKDTALALRDWRKGRDPVLMSLVRADRRRKQLRLAGKRQIRNTEQLADATASLWMQYRYALTPMAKSIEAALDVLLFANYGIYQTQRAGVSDPVDVQLDVDGHAVHARGTRRGRAWLKSRYTADLSDFARGIRFDLAPAVWDLLPLSIVTDWWLNVGDVISAATPPDIDRYDVMSYSVAYDLDFEVELEHSIVVGTIKAYDIRQIPPSQHVGLTYRPALNLKRQFDALALGWFAFKASHIREQARRL